MPGEAIRLDAAMLVLPQEKIAAVLMNLVNPQGKNQSEP
jgi:two-component system chemotaxis response regulator CheB